MRGGCRRGSRIQKGGGGSYIQKGGGGFVQEFQERIQIVAGSWANQQAKKVVGGGGVPNTPKNPVSAHGVYGGSVGEGWDGGSVDEGCGRRVFSPQTTYPLHLLFAL